MRAALDAAASLAKPPAPGLYLTATPIGNAADLSLRALAVLAAADLVACEDTRVTGKLLGLYGLSPKMMAHHDHNAATARPKILAAVEAGQVVALVSDAGTPLINDPGYRLVIEAADRGLPVTSLPGASAPTLALTLAGLPTDRFLYLGFAPPKAAARRDALADVAGVAATLVWLESAQRLPNFLADAAQVLGPRPAAVCRELTKKFEEVRRAPLGALAAHYAEAGPPKGEVVVVVGPPDPAAMAWDDGAVDAALSERLTAGLSTKDAAAEVAALAARPRRAVYARAQTLKGRG